jgi:hypothetical protein
MTTTNNIELTKEELELIELKRKEAALKAEQEKVQKQIEAQKEIEQAVKQIEAHKSKADNLIAAYKNYHKELGENYELVIVDKQCSKEVTGDYTNKQEPKANNYERELIWEKHYTVPVATIKHKTIKDLYIEVEEHIVYSSSSWSSKGQSKGFKMMITWYALDYASQNKKYSKADTVKGKIADKIIELQNKEDEARKKASAIDTAIAHYKQLLPTAEVTQDDIYTPPSRWDRSGNGTSTQAVGVLLQSGIRFKVTVYSDGSGSIQQVRFPNAATQEQKDNIINQLNQLTF